MLSRNTPWQGGKAMKKALAVLCILLVAGFSVFAAVDVKADDLALGAITEDSSLDGLTISVGTGAVSVDSSSAPAVDADGNLYSNVLTLSGDSLISFSAEECETLNVRGAVASDGSAYSLLLSSDSGLSETLTGTSEDGVTAVVEYVISATGTYTLSAAGGTASIYQVSVE